MEFDRIVRERYATKLFDGRRLPEDKVNELLDLIRYSPSSFNIQPWKVIVITDADLKEKLSPAAWHQKQITTCSHLLVFCANKDILGNIDRLEREMIKNGAKPQNIKGYIKVMRNFENGLSEAEKLSWAQRQAYLALGNALNGAKFLGFDSCPMEGFNTKDVIKILKLPSNLVPAALCPIGYAADENKEKLRFSKEELFDFY